MIEKIRILMLTIAISVLTYGGYIFLSTFQTASENIDVKFDKDGLDVKIENFKVEHDSSGRKDWELKADLAQINQKEETTKMNNVEYIYIDDEKREFKVFADFGTLKNDTNDLTLEGNVKMLIATALAENKITDKLNSKNKLKLSDQ